VYGAPVCQEQQTGYIAGLGNTTTNCSNASFKSGDATYVSAGAWYYACSPYGVYDTNVHGGGPPAGSGIVFTAPTFLDTSGATPAKSSLKLNGVTVYMGCTASCQKAKNDITLQGNNAMSLAAPNSCKGNGIQSGSSVDFPNGANYNRTDTVPAAVDGTSPAADSSQGQLMYPNVDFLISGDITCTSPALVWQGEMGASIQHQHLHFLLFSKNSDLTGGNTVGSAFNLTGGGQENWWGILHTFPTYSGYPNPPAVTDALSATGTDACSGCSISAGGNAAASPNGPPFLTGQIIADSASIGGNATVEVFNRPSGAPNGPGSSLVQ
jgi:hypothetical protein